MSLFKPMSGIILGLLLALVSSARAQEADAYLRELDSEASDLSLDRKTQRKPNESLDMRSAARLAEVPAEEAHDLVPGLSREAFEKSLKRNYMGSYTFYRRLSPERQDAIFAAYQQNADPQALRKKIMKALKQQRGKK